ncbi:MAG: adenosylcobalamin-dependent ribonucleoside-diphosphate reductase [Candidatus Lokiarchaeota archaeon]|nr:adenosylcobalamin-dependent ribonucleoside-diphosphate reductase [Candidatus Lokiarchaeota archaeon]
MSKIIKDLDITDTAFTVLKERYLIKNDKGKIIETPKQMIRRVASLVAKADLKYDKKVDITSIEQQFFDLMSNFYFLPNSPTLMNAGTEIGQLSACFVIPIEDNLVSIFEAVKKTAIIHQTGGGTGFSFSKLRPKGDIVRGTSGVASGPISFMKVFDTTTEVIKQGGRRRGANMGILNVHHPDILDFIICKGEEEILTNFNISVTITDTFMNAVKKNQGYDLINPRTNKVVKQLNAKNIFDLIIQNAWNTGDPGIVFLDTMNKFNPTPDLGKIESTNPCGEVPLLPYESCNLGSINLSKLVKNNKFDFQKLKNIIKLAVHFLDNVIDVNLFPFPEIEKITRGNRKIGLGVMGFADCLTRLRISYNSDEGVEFARKIMKFISDEANSTSIQLAETRGPFPNYKKSVYFKDKIKIRNATRTSCAPTGTISLIANCSSGIEPIFAIAYTKHILDNIFYDINPVFEEIIRKEELYSEKLMKKIADLGSIQSIPEIPEHIKSIFVTSLDISPEYHVRTQAAFQEFTDNSVSKTINFDENASIDDIKKAILLAYDLGCKGITIYRYGSRTGQVLQLGKQHLDEKEKMKVQRCPQCNSDLETKSSCILCRQCGFSSCLI